MIKTPTNGRSKTTPASGPVKKLPQTGNLCADAGVLCEAERQVEDLAEDLAAEQNIETRTDVAQCSGSQQTKRGVR